MHGTRRWLVTFLLVAAGCKDAPPRPTDVPEDATPTSGEGEQHWVWCQPENAGRFRCGVWSRDGTHLMHGAFMVERTPFHSTASTPLTDVDPERFDGRQIMFEDGRALVPDGEVRRPHIGLREVHAAGWPTGASSYETAAAAVASSPLVERLHRLVKLSDAQAVRIANVLTHVKYEAQGTGAGQDAHAAVVEAAGKVRTRIRAELTPDQQKLFDARF